MAEKEYIERGELADFLKQEIAKCNEELDDGFGDDCYDQAVRSRMTALICVWRRISSKPDADVVEVDDISDKIIRKKAEVSDYWHNDVKKYRVMQGYSDIEHDVDNFLRGYNEAIEDVLAILDGTPQKERADNG